MWEPRTPRLMLPGDDEFAFVDPYLCSLAPERMMMAAAGFASNIPVTANLRLHYRSDLGVTKDGGDLVSNWADQSGNGDDLVQATGTNQPLWVDTAMNGYPVIRADGVDNWLTADVRRYKPAFPFLCCAEPDYLGIQRHDSFGENIALNPD